jgi:hypothetical protein
MILPIILTVILIILIITWGASLYDVVHVLRGNPLSTGLCRRAITISTNFCRRVVSFVWGALLHKFIQQ